MTDTDDLVRRLRDPAHSYLFATSHQAADTIERLKQQLPDEMQSCTILFVECEQGHGRLTADNWVDHGCHVCHIEFLERELAEARKDSERLDQLEEDWTFIRFGGWVMLEGLEYKLGIGLRAAIDAARQTREPLVHDMKDAEARLLPPNPDYKKADEVPTPEIESLERENERLKIENRWLRGGDAVSDIVYRYWADHMMCMQACDCFERMTKDLHRATSHQGHDHKETE